MKVLILGNTAGVMYPMHKWLLENGHASKLCIMRPQDTLYKVAGREGVITVETGMEFFKTSIRLVRKFKPDVIHLNSVARLLPLIRLFAINIPTIYAHHGPGKQNFIGSYDVATALADFIQITTPDVRVDGIWLDRLISDKFYDRGGREMATALLMYRDTFYVDSRAKAQEWAEDHGIKLTILNQSEGDFVLHDDMPEYLSKFEYFLDWKGMQDGINGERTLSVAAMEAAACGCKIIHDSDTSVVLNNIKITKPEDYYDIYSSLKKVSRKRVILRYLSVFKGLLLWAKCEVINKLKGEKMYD